MYQFPLFEETPITQEEIEAYLDKIPTLSKSPWRRAIYAKAWHVKEKIQQQKNQDQRVKT
jgi:hypothetical protein